MTRNLRKIGSWIGILSLVGSIVSSGSWANDEKTEKTAKATPVSPISKDEREMDPGIWVMGAGGSLLVGTMASNVSRESARELTNQVGDVRRNADRLRSLALLPYQGVTSEEVSRIEAQNLIRRAQYGEHAVTPLDEARQLLDNPQFKPNVLAEEQVANIENSRRVIQQFKHLSQEKVDALLRSARRQRILGGIFGVAGLGGAAWSISNLFHKKDAVEALSAPIAAPAASASASSAQ